MRSAPARPRASLLRRSVRLPQRAVLRLALLWILVALAYVVASRLPVAAALLNGRGAPAWHPAGVAVAALYLFGEALWPGVLAGAVVANLLAGSPLLSSTIIGIASTAGPVLGVVLLRRAAFRPQLDRLVDVPLLVLAAAISAVVAATVGLLALATEGIAARRVPVVWSSWAMGDAASMFVLAGFLFAWLSPPVVDLARRRPLESLFALGSVAAVASIFFFDLLDLRASGESVAFPVIPVLIWIAFRVGPRGTSLAAVVVSLLAVAATDRGLGPFVGATREGSIFYVVAFVGLATTSAAAVSAVVAERDAAAMALAGERETLAARAAILQRLVSYSRRISGVLAEGALYPLCVAALDAVVPADLVGLTVLDRASGTYVVRAEKGSAGSVGRAIEPGAGPAGRAILERGVVLLAPYARSDFPPTLRDLNAADAYAEAVGVPLVRDGSVIGSLTVARVDPELPFTDLELEALALLADEITLAAANALLHGEVADLAIHDPLTGLHNRRYFDAALPQVLATRARLPGDGRPPVSAVLFDLDEFGRFNMANGHQAGDEALRIFAGILRRRLRASDLVARYGGEEFIAVLVGANRDAAVLIADDIRRSLAQSVIRGLEETPLAVTVSGGCAALDDEDVTGEQLIHAADIALVMAKRAGRNVVVAV